MLVSNSSQRDAAGHAANRPSFNAWEPIPCVGFSLLDAGRLYARCFQGLARQFKLNLKQCSCCP